MIDGPAYIRPHKPNHRQWAIIPPAQWRRPAVVDRKPLGDVSK